MADDTLIKKMEIMISTILESESFEENNDELSVDDLDNIFGGVTVPEFQKFLQYVQEKNSKEKNN